MDNPVVIDGDVVKFDPMFAQATVIVSAGKIRASTRMQPSAKPVPPGAQRPLSEGINGKAVCVEGDERSVEVPGCAYTTPAYPIPGVGTLKIRALRADGKSMTEKIDGKAVLVHTGRFTAAFQVTAPAKKQAPPGAPIPDPTREYAGQGEFVPSNTMRKA